MTPTKVGRALPGRVFTSRDTVGSHWGGAEGYARQRRSSEVFLGATLPGKRVVEASVLVCDLSRIGGF